MNAAELSVVIPSYNEAARLRRLLPHIRDHLRDRAHEIIVVNDGSQDDTAAVARGFPGVQVIEWQPNRGKGAAVKAGMLAARGEYVLFTDADESTPIGEVDQLLAKVAAGGYDMAIGSRAAPGAQVGAAQVWYRTLAGKMFGVATRVLCLRGIRDTQCGFKLMKRAVAQKVFLQVTSPTAIFDIEMLVVAARAGYRVAEVPVTWAHDPDTRIPYTLRRALQIWAELFRIRRAQRVGWPVRIQS